MDNKTLCPSFFLNVMNDSFGVYKTCCLHVPIKDNKVVGVPVDEKMDAFWNSEYMKTARINSINGNPTKGCEECYQSERNGGTSLRNDLLKTHKDNDNFKQRVEYAKNNGGHLNESPSLIELRVSNKCNLKCRMCQPQDSELINQEYIELVESNSDLKNILPIVDFDITDDLTNYIENIKANASTLKLIRFSGGEPLINDSFYDLLDFLIEGDYCKDIDFKINTNLTKMRLDTLEKLSKFKSVGIDFSIDGIEEVYEYIRFPMKWEITNNKIDLVQNYRDQKGSNISMNANFTVQIYNILNMFKLIDFFLSKSIIPILHILQNPSYLNIRHMPNELKSKVNEKIDETLKTIDSKNYPVKSQVMWVKERLVAIKNQMSLESDEYQVKQYRQFTMTLDIKRNQNINQTIPEISKYYE